MDTLSALSVDPFDVAAGLPEPRPLSAAFPHAPKRNAECLSPNETLLALRNALRYVPEQWRTSAIACAFLFVFTPTPSDAVLGPEFLEELRTYGHIYAYRFRPRYAMRAHRVGEYPAKSRQAACVQLMIMNNLDPAVAQFPEELITYGGNGSVFSNWMQFRLAMFYLSHMSDEQTLVMYSGHPAGLFPSHREAPRVVITNGMVIWNYSRPVDLDRNYALGVSQYGQMTAGSYCYIGPQGIVHGTTLTLLGASRKYLGKDDLTGVVFVSAGLGGMSGAQPKAAVICGAIGVIAEVDPAAMHKRHAQGWVQEIVESVDACVVRIREARAARRPASIGFLGNVVALWERLAEEKDLLVELGSDQTSLHNPYNGGYYPVQLSFDEAKRVMTEDPARFRTLVQESLLRQIAAIDKLSARGMRFWDYGNSFLLECSRVRPDLQVEGGGFRYPSYIQDVLGDVFSLGFGPFRWVCASNDPADLRATDLIAAQVMREQLKHANPLSAAQIEDNLRWIEQAEENRLVVGSQARILYSDASGRAAIAAEMNRAVADGRLQAPVVISRDHHDVSGTDAPFRETSNITDGSMFCADMAVQNFVGDSFRGATWVALHNGGGTGWGVAVNGGFGLVLDGSAEAEARAKQMLFWDVNNGVARRAWAGNSNAALAIRIAMAATPTLQVTLSHPVAEGLQRDLQQAIEKK
jgi:urocanate hydratase